MGLLLRWVGGEKKVWSVVRVPDAGAEDVRQLSRSIERLKGRERNRCNRAGQALRQAAVGLSTSKSALGAYFRRMAGRLGKGSAIKATAHKLARLIYAALTKGMVHVDRGMAAEEERYRVRALEHLAKRAAALAYSLSPTLQEAK
jgi:transposase